MHQEGQVQFERGGAFYRPQAKMARDLGVLAAAVQRREGEVRLLEVMAGCGVRSLRYAVEAGVDWLWVNEANLDLGAVLARNFEQLGGDRYRLTQTSAVGILLDCDRQEQRFEFVDIDLFGNGSRYLGLGLGAVKPGGLLYLTATDGRSLGGHAPAESLLHYGSYARAHPSSQEQALRILLYALHQQANQRSLSIQPLVSYFSGPAYRVLVRVLRGHNRPTPPKRSDTQGRAGFPSGFLGYCHRCGEYQVLSWRTLNRSSCPECSPAFNPDSSLGFNPDSSLGFNPGFNPDRQLDRQPDRQSALVLSGPLWLGPLHEPDFVRAMADQAQRWHWDKAISLLNLLAAEALLPPYYFPLGEIGRRGSMDPPPRDRLLQALQDAGYPSSRSHCHPAALKTTASLKTCLTLAQSLPLKE